MEIGVAHAKTGQHLFKAKWCFSTLDLHTGYITYSLKKIIRKTALASPFGKYEYLKVPFGLSQAPAYFQELMNKVLKDLPLPIAYLDGNIIYSKTKKEHLDHL